jgi:hypothetical protein
MGTERIERSRKYASGRADGKLGLTSLTGAARQNAIDRPILSQEIEAILQDAAGNFPAPEEVVGHMEILVQAARRDEVRTAAEQAITILSLDLDDLRRAALLSLMVRCIGRQRFDSVATYVFKDREIYVTSRG